MNVKKGLKLINTRIALNSLFI